MTTDDPTTQPVDPREPGTLPWRVENDGIVAERPFYGPNGEEGWGVVTLFPGDPGWTDEDAWLRELGL